jgi:hypothetical protein
MFTEKKTTQTTIADYPQVRQDFLEEISVKYCFTFLAPIMRWCHSQIVLASALSMSRIDLDVGCVAGGVLL